MTDPVKLEEGWYWVRRVGYASREPAILLSAGGDKMSVTLIGDEETYFAEAFEIGPRIHPPGGEG